MSPQVILINYLGCFNQFIELLVETILEQLQKQTIGSGL